MCVHNMTVIFCDIMASNQRSTPPMFVLVSEPVHFHSKFLLPSSLMSPSLISPPPFPVFLPSQLLLTHACAPPLPGLCSLVLCVPSPPLSSLSSPVGAYTALFPLCCSHLSPAFQLSPTSLSAPLSCFTQPLSCLSSSLSPPLSPSLSLPLSPSHSPPASPHPGLTQLLLIPGCALSPQARNRVKHG